MTDVRNNSSQPHTGSLVIVVPEPTRGVSQNGFSAIEEVLSQPIVN